MLHVAACLFTAAAPFYFVLYDFFDNLQEVIFMVILGSSAADFDLCGFLLCRQI